MLKYITIHWTAGPYKATYLDKRHYHFAVEDDGRVVTCDHKPEANIPPLRDYAAHCGGGNSHNIGIAVCCCAGYKGPTSPGAYRMTAKQFEAMCAKVAQLCIQYKIPVSAQYVFTHYEFGKRHPQTSSSGKIDITYLPFAPKLSPDAVGDYIREKVLWYKQKLLKGA